MIKLIEDWINNSSPGNYYVALHDGNFFDTKTWHNGFIPTKKAHVFIPQKRKVYYRASERLKYDKLRISLEPGSIVPTLLEKTETNNIQKCSEYVKKNKIELLVLGVLLLSIIGLLQNKCPTFEVQHLASFRFSVNSCNSGCK